ncbi:hypothetical protein MMC22_005703 [Lobaria immixta]|nr:hypothetical protein [Lobaria immixta]
MVLISPAIIFLTHRRLKARCPRTRTRLPRPRPKAARMDGAQQIQHLFTRVWIQFGTKDVYVDAIIDCGSLWNFVDQSLICRHKVPGDDNVPKKLSTVGVYPLKVYQRHVAVVEVQDHFENILSGCYTLLGTDIGGVGMILGRSWLISVSVLFFVGRHGAGRLPGIEALQTGFLYRRSRCGQTRIGIYVKSNTIFQSKIPATITLLVKVTESPI